MLRKPLLDGGISGGTLILGRGYFGKTTLFECTMALTDTEIKEAKPKEKPYRMSDSGGMYLWGTPSGGRLWRGDTLFEGKEKLMAFRQVSSRITCSRQGTTR